MEELEDQWSATTSQDLIVEIAALALSQASTIEIQEEELESNRRLLRELGIFPSTAARLVGKNDDDDDDQLGEDCIDSNESAERPDSSGYVDVLEDREVMNDDDIDAGQREEREVGFSYLRLLMQ